VPDVEQCRGAARIVKEHLVEIAHAIEQQHIGVLRLDAQVLLHHRGVRSQCSVGVGRWGGSHGL
jgi:predicted transcriptional regulator